MERVLANFQGEGLKAQLVRGAMGVGGLKLLSLPLVLLATVLLARVLGPDGFGQYAFVIALVTSLSIPFGPALTQLATREAAASHQAGETGQVLALLRWASRQVWVGSAVVFAVVGSIAAWNAEWRVDDRWTLLLLGLAIIPLVGLNAVRSGVLAGLRHVVMGQIPELFVRPLGLLIVAAGLFLFGALNPASALAAFTLGAALALLVGTILLRRRFPLADASRAQLYPQQSRQWLRAWPPFSLLAAVSTLNAQIGILLLGWLSSDDQVAAMQVAERGALLVALSLTVVNLVIGPHITQVYQTGDTARLAALSRRSALVAILVALPIALPLIFFAQPVLDVVFGAEYARIAALPLVVLAIGQLVNVGFGSVGMLLVMSGFERDALRGHLLALGVNAVAALVLIPPLGAVGAALASALGLLIWNVVLALMVTRRLSIAATPFLPNLDSRR